MRPIPLKLRKQLNNDEFMAKCIYPDCLLPPEYEHAFIYSGRQVNTWWAIVPCCTYHHRGRGLDKEYNQYVALFRAEEAQIIEKIQEEFPKVDWIQKLNYLKKKYVRIKRS